MELPSFITHWSPFRRHSAAQADSRVEGALKAVRLLGAQRLADARDRAESTLKGARSCACCANLLAHLFDRLGSTLFLDDDPLELVQAFDASERDLFSPRVLAACIVLKGRERVAPAW